MGQKGGGDVVLWLGRGEREGIYLLLADLLAAEYGIAPPPAVARTPSGKPYFPALPHLHFNVSHSGGFLLCGVGEVPLGVDVECVRPRGKGLPRYVLSDREYDWYVGRGCRWADFYTLWTLKESRVKCEGGGLRRPAREISVPLLEVGESATWEGYTLRAYGGVDWRGALCAHGIDMPNIFLVS